MLAFTAMVSELQNMLDKICILQSNEQDTVILQANESEKIGMLIETEKGHLEVHSMGKDVRSGEIALPIKELQNILAQMELTVDVTVLCQGNTIIFRQQSSEWSICGSEPAISAVESDSEDFIMVQKDIFLNVMSEMDTVVCKLPNDKFCEFFHLDTEERCVKLCNKHIGTIWDFEFVSHTLKSLAFPRSRLEILKKLLDNSGASRIILLQDGGRLAMISSGLAYIVPNLVTEFPDLQKVFQEGWEFSFTIFRQDVIDKLSDLKEQGARTVTLQNKDGKLYVYYDGKGMMKRLDVKGSMMSASLYISFNVDYLLSAFKSMAEESVLCRGDGEKKVFIVETASRRFAVMPIEVASRAELVNRFQEAQSKCMDKE